jgi:RNA:NAD 2'-phosphotransferase (TPT1/KptA family)
MRQEQRFKAISKVMSWALRHEAERLKRVLRWSSTGNVAAWPASPLGDFRPILR